MTEALKRLHWRFLLPLLLAVAATWPAWGAPPEARGVFKSQGPVADGAATIGFPTLVGGWDGTLTHIFKTNGNGDIVTAPPTGTSSTTVQGTAADGAAAVGNPVQVGGVDGSGNAQAWLMGTTGAGVIRGEVAAGGAASGTNPVLIACQDNSSGNIGAPRFASSTGAASGTSNLLGTVPVLWDGSAYSPARMANTVSGTTGTGLPGAGGMMFDGTNWQPLRAAVGVSGISTGTQHLATVIGVNDTVANLIKNVRAVRGLADATTGDDSVATGSLRFNGSTWDRERNNTQEAALNSAARTTQTDTSDLINYNGRGIIIYVDVTTGAATPGVTPTLQMKDSITGGYKTIWTAAAAITSTAAASYTYALYPGATAAVGLTETQSTVIPRTYRLRFTVADADSLTYSASVATIQ